MRPNVEMPEKTESAYEKYQLTFFFCSYDAFTDLSTTVSRQSIVPQTLVRASNRLLLGIVVTVSLSNGGKTEQERKS